MRPATIAIVALTFSVYALKPFFPECTPPEEAQKLLAAICICEFTYRYRYRWTKIKSASANPPKVPGFYVFEVLARANDCRNDLKNLYFFYRLGNGTIKNPSSFDY